MIRIQHNIISKSRIPIATLKNTECGISDLFVVVVKRYFHESVRLLNPGMGA